MTRLIQFANNAVSRLAANITAAATTITLTPGDGAKFPAISAGQYFMGTLVKSDGTTEVVKVTARSTDTLTVVRAAEPVAGSATAYAFSANDKFEARLTASGLSGELDRIETIALLDSISAINKSANYTVTAADVNALIRVSTAAGGVTITLPQISTLTSDFDLLVAKVTSDANVVAVTRSGTDTINGNTVYNLTTHFQSCWLVADRSTNTWTAISSSATGVNAIADEGTLTASNTITLSGDPGSKNNTAVFVGGVYQQKNTYSMSVTGGIATITLGGTVTASYSVVWTAPLTIGTPADLSVSTGKVVDNAITYAKMQQVSAGKVLGRDTSGDGVVQELPIAVNSSGEVGIGGAPEAGSLVRLYKNGTAKMTIEGNDAGSAFINYSGASNEMSAGYDRPAGAFKITATGDLASNIRFNLDLNGNLNLPNQPSFSGWRTSGDVSPGNVYVLNNMNTNVGGWYSTSTGRFTAPVAGKYSFSACITMLGTITRIIFFRVNGSAIVGACDENNGGSGYYSAVPIGAILTLAANDYVDLYIQSGSGYGQSVINYRGFFSGQLIS